MEFEKILRIASYSFISSMIILIIITSTKSVITIDVFNWNIYKWNIPNIYLTMLYRDLWYLSIFMFLQSSLIIINGEYNEKEANNIFYLQIILIVSSEMWAMIDSFKYSIIL